MTMVRARVLQFLLLTVSLVAIATAGEPFPGQTPDRRIIKTQEKVDVLFDKGKYGRAMFIYRHELAPLGDKYAQYMVGYMFLAGKGVEEDLAAAAAWYRLAAERQHKTFVDEHTRLHLLLNEAQRVRSDEIYVALRGELGDAALIGRLIDEDLQSLRARIREDPFAQDIISRSNFDRRESIYQQTARRIRSRINYLEDKLASDDLVIDIERQRFRELQARVERELREFEASR